MSVDNVKKFYQAIAADENLRQELSELSRQHTQPGLSEAEVMKAAESVVLPVAARLGLSFTLADLAQYAKEQGGELSDRDLSDDELAAVTGGDTAGFCVLGGYGAGTNPCICVLGGHGANGITNGTCVVMGFFTNFAAEF